MSGWVQILLTAVGIVFGGGTMAVLVNAFTGRKARKADVTDRMSDQALKWVEQFQEEAANARREAVDARRELAEVRQEMRTVRIEAEALARELRNLRLEIMSPSTSLERLRAIVEGSANGRP